MKKYFYIRKGILRVIESDEPIKNASDKYNAPNWTLLSDEQVEFYKAHPAASMGEILNMKLFEPVEYVPQYAELVSQYIREKYTVDDEIAIIRQKDEKTDKFEEYYTFCELCKEKAKNELNK
jgi:hypothetical protein